MADLVRALYFMVGDFIFQSICLTLQPYGLFVFNINYGLASSWPMSLWFTCFGYRSRVGMCCNDLSEVFQTTF